MNRIDQDTLGQEQNPDAAPEANAQQDEAIPQPSSRSVIAELVAISSGLLSGGVKVKTGEAFVTPVAGPIAVARLSCLGSISDVTADSRRNGIAFLNHEIHE